jgi:hypothetical protein
VAGSTLDISQIRSVTSTLSFGLGGGVDGDKDQVGLDDSLVDIGREEEVTSTAATNNLVQTRLVDGKFVRVPGCDSVGVKVDDGNLDVRVLCGDDGTCRTTCMTDNTPQLE